MLQIVTEMKPTEEGHTHVQWICGIIANSLLFCYGLQAGWMSPAARALQAPGAGPVGAPLSDAAVGWLASAVPITALLCVPLFAYLTDRIGRKKTILIITLPQVATWLLKMLPSMTCLVLARACSGAAAAGCYVAVPAYNKEVSSDRHRGALGSLLIMSYNLGVLAMYALGNYLSYHTVLYVALPVPILSFLFMLKCPESPEYLVKTGKLSQATKALSILRSLEESDKQIEDEIYAMKKRDEYYKSLPSLSMVAIVKDKAWRKAAILASIMISVQAFSGNFALVSFGASVLAAAAPAQTMADGGVLATAAPAADGGASVLAADGGVLATAAPAADGGASVLAADGGLRTLAFPALMMVGSVLSMCFVERVGRKVLLLSTYVVSAGALASLAGLLQRGAPSWAPPAAASLAMLAYAGGVQPGAYIVMAELFNIQIRAKLMGAIVALAWVVSFVQLAAFAPISSTLGLHANFYLFAASHLLGAAALLVYLPETRGKSVEELEKELRK